MHTACLMAVALMGLSLGAFSPLHSQNVGIGTNAPLDRLHVAGNVRVDGLAGAATRIVGANAVGTLVIVAPGINGQVLTQTAGGPIWQNASTDWTILGNTGTSAITNFIGTADNTDFVTRTNNTERMRVTNGGSVGIGTSGPTDRLQVNGNVRIGIDNPANTGTLPSFGNYLYFSGGNAGPTFSSDNSDPLWMARYNAGSDVTELRMNLGDNCGTGEAFVIQDGGAGCPVTDYFRFENSGNAFKIGGGAWSAFSDRRLKKDIQPFTDGLNVVNAVQPVTYQYNGLNRTPNDGRILTGVIAQDLQAIAPYMVEPMGEYLTVDPSAFTYILLNAVKEQQAQIDALKLEVEALRGR